MKQFNNNKLEKVLSKNNIILFFIASFCLILFLNIITNNYFGEGLNLMLILGIITFGVFLFKFKIKK